MENESSFIDTEIKDYLTDLPDGFKCFVYNKLIMVINNYISHKKISNGIWFYINLKKEELIGYLIFEYLKAVSKCKSKGISFENRQKYINGFLRNSTRNFIKRNVIGKRGLIFSDVNMSEIIKPEKQSGIGISLRPLKTKEKQIIYLKYCKDLSNQDICQILGLSYSNLNKIHTRAIHKLEKAYPELKSHYDRLVRFRKDDAA